jgi:hypothetical protein
MCVAVYVRVHELGDDRLPVGDLSNQGVVLLAEFLHPAEERGRDTGEEPRQSLIGQARHPP